MASVGTCSGKDKTYQVRFQSEQVLVTILLNRFSSNLDKSSLFLGVPVGSVIASTLGGRLCTWFGWRSVFWAAGACNVVFVLLWFRLGAFLNFCYYS